MRYLRPLDRSLCLAILLVVTSGCRTASSGQEPRAPIDIPESAETFRLAEAWWRAFTLGDTAYLERNTGEDLVLVLSTGKSYNRTGMLRTAATHRAQAIPVGPALDAKMLHVSPSGAVVASSVREGNNTYRYMTVLKLAGAWRVVGAQSTRVPLIAARVPESVSGALGDYAGSYRGGQGGTVRIALADSVLTLIQPNGEQLRLEPIGPALFEVVIPNTSNITMQFLFARDARGQVASLSRIYNGIVVTWGRIP